MVSLRSLVAGVALIAAPVMAALSPAELVERINELTKKSQALHAPVDSITIVNAPLVAVGRGPLPEIMTAGADILSTATGLMSSLDGIPQDANEAEVTMILDAFHDCVHVNQDLLTLIVSKTDPFKAIPVVGRVVTVLLGPFEVFANAFARFSIMTSEFWAEQLKARANCMDATRTTGVENDKGIIVKRAEVFVA
ncbi:hypothetical protein B0I37DRAFT_352199 [Chaetomium sp. MPI-CAGE-AT-0009]|nr:hypothetical protein B0I37DRAFT_352199 [Chaetomium sp. MPI-CAGE-AT-0009]